MQQSAYHILAKKLDLDEYLRQFSEFFARYKEPHLQGDIQHFLILLQALENITFTRPPHIASLDRDIVHLKKQGFLHKSEIFEWVKLCRYMLYLKNIPCEGKLKQWWDKIVFPAPILDMLDKFTEKAEFKTGVFLELDSLYQALKDTQKEKQKGLYDYLHSSSLSHFLVDAQLHLLDDEETLLVRPGFNAAIKAEIVGRSTTGFFYILPHSLLKLREKLRDIQTKITLKEYEICSSFSKVMAKHIPFLSYINKEFDKFDHLQARLSFAKAKGLEFLPPSKDKKIILHEFIHPALKHPKPISIDFTKPILLITGVNAGGKTMLLKSLLSVAFLSRYLLPMSLNASKSHVGNFKEIEAILDDPQNVNHDISTFAGRMLSFSTLFGANKAGSLIGVDEIELGTDSDEAASLFKVILERLLKHQNKIVLTTHHKRLAALMSTNEDLELVAALYDEKHRRPMFSFLQGTIGKSYAFETALRYNIPADIVKEAKVLYGEDKEKLGELIEKSAQLEVILHKKKRDLDREMQKVIKKKQELKELVLKQHEDFKKRIHELERDYLEATRIAKEAAKKESQSAIHQGINNANKIWQQIKKDQQELSIQIEATFEVGDRVKIRKNRGKIVGFKGQKAIVELDEGMKIHVSLHELKKADAAMLQNKVSLDLKAKEHRSGVSLDLHGLRSEEAIERLDVFLSDALISGFDEVLVYHGIGTGKLAYAVKEFLKTHPKVRSFNDAPIQMGGFGAKIVKL